MKSIIHKYILSLIILLGVFSSVNAVEPTVGRVVFVKGTVTSIDAVTNVPRILRRDSRIEAGETITTRENSIIQLVFPDRSMLHIKPNTKVLLEHYRFTPKGSDKDGMVTDILKGGMRSLTGALGKRDKKKIQFKTPVATIGIRGTALEMRENTGQSGWAITFDYGSGFTLNDGGETALGAGESASTDSKNDAAQKFDFQRPDDDAAVIARKLVDAPLSDVEPETKAVCKLLGTDDAILLIGIENQVPGFKNPVLLSTVKGLVVCMPLSEFAIILTAATILYPDLAADLLRAAVEGTVDVAIALEAILRGLEDPDSTKLDMVLKTALDLGITEEAATKILMNLKIEGICL